MKIYIITDLEGAAMISRFDQTRDVTPEDKAVSMKLLTWEVNAAVDGILDVDTDAEVVVWDGHGSGGIDVLELHSGAKLIPRGPISPPYYMDENFDALFFVGQHAMAGTEAAPLCHTYSSKTIEYFKLNGVFVGEFGTRAVMAGTLGVPTVFISGDDKAVAEAEVLVPCIFGAAVKQGRARESAIHLSPKAAHKLIREVSSEACKNIDSIPPVRMDPPYTLEIRVLEGKKIDGYLKRPGAEKTDGRTVIIKSDNICDLPI